MTLFRRLADATSLDEEQARTVIATLGGCVLIFIVALAWGHGGVLWVVVLLVAYLLRRGGVAGERVDEVSEETSQAHGKADAALEKATEALDLTNALIDDLQRGDEPSTGRHARSDSPTSPRSPA